MSRTCSSLVLLGLVFCQAQPLRAQPPTLEGVELEATKSLPVLMQETRYEQLRLSKIRLEREWRDLQETLTGYAVKTEQQATSGAVPEGQEPETWRQYAANSVQQWNRSRALEGRIAEVKAQMVIIRKFLDQARR